MQISADLPLQRFALGVVDRPPGRPVDRYRERAEHGQNPNPLPAARGRAVAVAARKGDSTTARRRHPHRSPRDTMAPHTRRRPANGQRTRSPGFLLSRRAARDATPRHQPTTSCSPLPICRAPATRHARLMWPCAYRAVPPLAPRRRPTQAGRRDNAFPCHESHQGS